MLGSRQSRCLLGFVLVVLSLAPSSRAVGQNLEFLCRPTWRVGDSIVSHATLVIRTGRVGNIIFEYLRTELIVWRGAVRLPEGLSLAGDAYVLKRVKLGSARQKRYRGGWSNLEPPPALYDGTDLVDVYTGQYQYFATLRLPAGFTGAWADLDRARRVRNMTTDGGPTWPLVPGRRTVKTYQSRDMTVEVKPEVLNVPSVGTIATLVVSDEVTDQQGRWVRRAWFASQTSFPVRREWIWPSSDFSLELEKFRPTSAGSPTAPAEKPIIIPSVGLACVRAGFTDTRPDLPPQETSDRLRGDGPIHFFVAASVPPIRDDVTVTPVVRLLRDGGEEVDRWTSVPLHLRPGWISFWFFRTYAAGRLEPGAYVAEGLVGDVVIASGRLTVGP